MSDLELLKYLPDNGALDSAGQLTLNGRRLLDIAHEFGTPCYVVDESALRAQARRYQRAFTARWPNTKVLFASKAFPCTAVYRTLAEEGLSCDVAGLGELEMALAGGFDPADVFVHGNAKTDSEIQAAVGYGAGTFIVDNADDVDRLERWAPPGQAVMLRIIPDIVVDTHESMVTGQTTSKFGLPADQARDTLARLARSRMDVRGVHCHIGSQVLDLSSFERIPAALAQFGRFPAYNFGGGLGVRYCASQHPPNLDEYAQVLTQAAQEHLPADAQIMIEPGRSMVAQSTVTLYTVTTVKRTGKTFVAVDGGMGDNLEAALLQLPLGAAIVTRPHGSELCELVGRHCESGDRLATDVPLNDPRVGDALVLPMTGAYSYTTANNYNGALRSPVVFSQDDGSTRLMVRRESLDDLFARDID